MDITQFQVKEGEKGKFLKGARLWLYPPGYVNLSVQSRCETKCSYSEAKRKVSAATLTFQSNLRVDCTGYKSNTISKSIIIRRFLAVKRSEMDFVLIRPLERFWRF